MPKVSFEMATEMSSFAIESWNADFAEDLGLES